MLFECEIVSGDVPQIDIADFKHRPDIGTDIGRGRYCSARKDYKYQQDHFAAGKERPLVGVILEPVIINELQHSPDDQQSGPISRDVSPEADVIAEVSSQQKDACANQDKAPEDATCASPHSFSPSFLL